MLKYVRRPQDPREAKMLEKDNFREIIDWCGGKFVWSDYYDAHILIVPWQDDPVHIGYMVMKLPWGDWKSMAYSTFLKEYELQEDSRIELQEDSRIELVTDD